MLRKHSLTVPFLLVPVLAFGQLNVIDPASNENIPAAQDYATTSFQDPWDMSQKSDLGWFTFQPDSNLTDIQFQGGTFSAMSATSDPLIFVLDTAVPGTAFLGKIGANFPINADQFTRFCFRMRVANAANAQLFWSKNTIFNGQSGTMEFGVYAGWNIGILDIPSTPLALSAAGTWSGLVDSLRFDPTTASGQNIEIDWIRLVQFESTLNRTIRWSGASGNVDIYLDDDQNAGNGNLGALAKNVPGSLLTFNVGCLPRGTYYVAITGAGGSSFAYSAGAYIVNDIPTLEFTSPSPEGSTDDFATTRLGNPWDMNSISDDIDLLFNIDSPAITNVSGVEDEAGNDLGTIRVFAGQSQAASSGNVGDPNFYPLWATKRGAVAQIDSNRYRVLVLEMGVPGERDLVGGSVARVVWKKLGAAPTQQIVSQDIVLRSDSPNLVMNKIIADMKTLPIEPDASQTAWDGLIDAFRVDPHEFSSPTAFAVRGIKLTALERADPSYTVRWSYTDAFSSNPGGATLSLYHDSDRSGFDGTLVAPGLDPTAGQFIWNTAGLPSGEYYLYALFSDGVNLNGSYAPWPIVVRSISLSVATNSSTYAGGNTLSASVNVTNEGVSRVVDFYFGALFPDGDTIVFFTDPSFNTGVGTLSDVSTLSPIVTGVDLDGPFTFNDPDFFTYRWLGNEPRGPYTLFLAAVAPGAFADGSVDGGDVVALGTATFTFN